MQLDKSIKFCSALRYSFIMAMDERGGIGMNNDLPWKLSRVDNKTDMAWFRQHTLGKIIIMGYNTWVSIGRKPLPGRYNVIISKAHRQEVIADIAKWGDDYYKTEKGQKEPIHSMVCDSVSAAMDALKAGIGDFHSGGEVMVIGGAKIYESFMPYVSRIYLTTFPHTYAADTFVHLDLSDWELRYRDNLKLFAPKFEVWDCTEKAAEKSDSDILQISYESKS